MSDLQTILREPRYDLVKAPTPLQRLSGFERKLGRPDLFMKRDDLMEIGLGGNKLRSLEFWLGAALRERADIVLVAGGATSNLCRLTAAAASIARLDCVIIHNAEDSPTNRERSFLNRLFGAETRFIGAVGEEERGAAMKAAAAELKRQGRTPYIVGDAVLGALGYVLAAFELHEQSQREATPLRHVFLAGSMGPTEAGFIFGNAMLGHPFQVHLVSVEYEQAELEARIRQIYDGIAERTGLTVGGLDEAPLHYHMAHLGGGWGVPTPESEAAIIAFARIEGILVEHVYTAKTCAGFLDLVANGAIPSGEPACILHTGGTASLFAQRGQFRTVN
ncbi:MULTISPECIES: pyridoxal-phosphate dependent enzyme [Bosea]|uniref:pyridoxal-phosphate dependent enzyme n=1 Tax=Bosea TaxID=85413 RepID=UPI0021500117|nr:MULTISPECIES: pyridoxal-phosphate dependent enzyme [Bosea]MCR4523230.1 pyridoxal-phosphate dependent enzyme [Bosea sp. 47.2.35]MDR6830222.1 1-aminocyclopropane-1-carboxylate deaminase/D-cysteine desulfhydrase-like pyridoxal-dependent ACC family enzyme [Bosea robiniae]MDR6895554.1 1-aminocyclopropane-1-carboxylate deaminase/D-cysteine desulfhydrase-like pyridoxal-dependent ACC family enzyme [Bosea sp. BE109]MDR7138950.1 1-aminocyclopropane-1-carboxylate deaminase/D-cysteine desulfhydrase-like